MKLPVRFRTMFVLCASFASSTAFPQSAPATPETESETNSDDGAVVTLDAFTITTDRERSYGAKTAPTALRLSAPLEDLPVNVNVMSNEFIMDMNESDTQNLLSWNASVSGGRNGLIRGLSGGGFFIDGHRYQTWYPVSTIERVEIIKGPSSVFVQRTNPGGTVNYVRAKPFHGQNFGRVKIGFGDGGKGQLRQHYGGDFNYTKGRFAVRVIADWAAYEDNNMPSFINTAMENGGSRFKAFYPSVNVQLSNKTDITVGVLYYSNVIRSQDGRHSARSITLPENGSFIPLSTKYGIDDFTDFAWGRHWNNVYTDIYAKLNHHFSPDLSLHLSFNHHSRRNGHHDTPTIVGAIPQFLADGVTPNTAQRPVARQTWERDRVENDIPSGTLFLHWRPRTELNKHVFTLGLSYDQDISKTKQWLGRVPGSTVVYTNDIWFLDAPILREGPAANAYSMVERGNNFRDTTFAAINANWHGQFMEGRLNLMAALSHAQSDDVFQSNGTVVSITPGGGSFTQAPVTVTPTAGPRRDFSTDSTNPMVGVLYKLTDSVSAFGMWSSSMDISQAVDGFGNGFGPVNASGFEAGFKLALPNDRVVGSITAYQITQTDTVVFDPQGDNLQYQQSVQAGTPNATLLGANAQVGEITSEGFEADLQLNLARNWIANISFAHGSTKITEDANPANVGRYRAGDIRNSITIFSKYTFTSGALDGLSFGGGLTNRSPTYDAGFGGFRLPGAKTVDLFAQYVWEHSDALSSKLQLNIRNALEASNAFYGYDLANHNRYRFKNPRIIWLDYTIEF